MKAPAFQFYTQDFIVGTMMMSAAEVGAYIRLLCYQWDKGGIPNDEAVACRIAGCDGNALASVWHKFGICEGGATRRNARMEEVRSKQLAYREKQRENASKRWAPLKDDAMAMPRQSQRNALHLQSSSSKNRVFCAPTPLEVTTYAGEIGYPMDGEAWCDRYAQNGWMAGRSKMKDWKAAVRNWKRMGWKPDKPKSNATDQRPNPRHYDNMPDYGGVENHGLGAKP